MGQPLQQWEERLKKTQQSKDLITSSEFWRESEIAIKSGKFETYFDLSVEERAWLIAAYETRETLQAAVDWVHEQERESNE